MRYDRPGYLERRRRDGSMARYWSPARAVKGSPPQLKMLRLDEALSDEEAAALCRKLTAELRAETGAAPAFNGTIEALCHAYMRDASSPFARLKHSTRRADYEPALRLLTATVGKRRIDMLRASDFQRWFDEWKKRSWRNAWGAVKMLRGVLTYGAGERLLGCRQARDILTHMRFPAPPRREVMMTYPEARAIVQAAIAEGLASLALTQAIQFETGLRRIDIIGEHIPQKGEPPRWQGLSRADISRDLILTKHTSKNAAFTAFDLKRCELVMLALQSYRLPDIGPVILNERTGKPWRRDDYIATFRHIRGLAGVRDEIHSRDSRAGAGSETFEATGRLEDSQHLLTHSDPKTTAIYTRSGAMKQTSRIAEARAKHRRDGDE